MTILFNNKTEALTVYPESVRGLRFQRGAWHLFVSDPEPMEVTTFKILPATLRDAAIYLDHGNNYNREKPLTIENAEAFFRWLLEKNDIYAELLPGAGQPSMFPLSKLAKPNPTLSPATPLVS
jgi:hypothetical protein